MLKKDIEKYALHNAVKYGGKANPGAVIGKLLSEHPGLKDKMKDVAKEVNEVLKEVNKMKPEEQLKKLEEIAPELLEKKKSKNSRIA